MILKHYENERGDNDMGDSERSANGSFLQNYSWRDKMVVTSVLGQWPILTYCDCIVILKQVIAIL